MHLEACALTYSVDEHTVLDELSMAVERAEVVGLLGPNGSGKTSLLRAVYRALRPQSGSLVIDGADVGTMPARELGRRMAVVAQERPADFEFTVEEVVAMGRTPHKGLFERDTEHDRAAVVEALEHVGMSAYASRVFPTLSGGEKQRVLIARALAQRADLLVLDEPTNHLDIRYQLEVMDLVRRLGVTAVVALHDLNIAASSCDRLVLVRAGRVVANGTPADVLTPERILDVFGVHAEVVEHPRTGCLQLLYIPPSHREKELA
jgi:iron complex transport system ATP-binding protein